MKSNDLEDPRYVIVIGASAGGLHSVIELMAQVTEEMSASIFVVLHTPHLFYADSIIQRLQRNSGFVCKVAENEEQFKPRHLYLGVHDKHLIIKRGQILLGSGPVENRWRPSIDVLFRSAAVAYDRRVIGVILTGLLDDGTRGMQIIKQCGGTCIVQDPAEAEYPDMPQSVLRNVEVDYCTSLQRIAIILQEKTRNGVYETHAIPASIRKEAEIAERVAVGIDDVASLGGQKSGYSCPDCGGGLWQLKNEDVTCFRCHTGHMYSSNELLAAKRKELENTLWVALRVLEERRNLLNKMSAEETGKGWVRSAADKTERAHELEAHISRLKETLFNSTDDPDRNIYELIG